MTFTVAYLSPAFRSVTRKFFGRALKSERKLADSLRKKLNRAGSKQHYTSTVDWNRVICVLHIATATSQTRQRNGVLLRCVKGPCEVQRTADAVEMSVTNGVIKGQKLRVPMHSNRK